MKSITIITGKRNTGKTKTLIALSQEAKAQNCAFSKFKIHRKTTHVFIDEAGPLEVIETDISHIQEIEKQLNISVHLYITTSCTISKSKLKTEVPTYLINCSKL